MRCAAELCTKTRTNAKRSHPRQLFNHLVAVFAVQAFLRQEADVFQALTKTAAVFVVIAFYYLTGIY